MPKDIPALIRNALLALIACTSIAAFIQTGYELNKLGIARRSAPFFFSGTKVAGLENLLKDERFLGYATDHDVARDAKTLAQFAQFQLQLAPLILDDKNLDHRFLIIDCDTPAGALKILRELKAKPLSRNNFGIILAVREGF